MNFANKSSKIYVENILINSGLLWAVAHRALQELIISATCYPSFMILRENR